MIPWIRIHSSDNVAVALTHLPAGEAVRVAGQSFVLPGPVPAGHKFALLTLSAGDDIIKYGAPIGHATQRIAPGEWVHTHNVRTNLSGLLEYQYRPQTPRPCAPLSGSFEGYARADTGTQPAVRPGQRRLRRNRPDGRRRADHSLHHGAGNAVGRSGAHAQDRHEQRSGRAQAALDGF